MSTESLLDWVGLALLLVVFARCVPLLLKANGTRPFVVMALLVALLFGWADVSALFHDQTWDGHVRRILGSLILLGTIEWSWRGHR